MWMLQLLLLVAWCCCASLATISPIWSLNQVGDYFNGIFRSIFGPLFGFGNITSTN